MDATNNKDEISPDSAEKYIDLPRKSDEDDMSIRYLIPNEDADVGKIYQTLLDESLDDENKGVTNIAITGPLGSGKSTLIRSFEKHHYKGGDKFAYISLAAFEFKDEGKCPEDTLKTKSISGDTKRSSNDTKSNRDDIVQTLEQNIINQIVAIPEDRSRKKSGKTTRRSANTSYPTEKSINNRNQFIAALISYILLVLIAIFICSNIQNISATAVIITAGILLVILALMGIWFVKTGSPALFKKISSGGVEIDLDNENSNISLFNNNIALMIRIFEARPNINIYVFEDIERLGFNIIYVHLRELNAILNSYFGGTRVIKFVYCISDDTLKQESRTKFFDVLIPIIPYTNGYNAYGHLIKQLGSVKNGLDDSLLRNVALYINDDRMLSCIVNDYNVYLALLYSEGNQNFNKNELFALMALKNATPLLFANLQTRTGEIYKLLGAKDNKEEIDEFGKRKISSERIRKAIQNDMDKYNEQAIDYATDLACYLIINRYIEEDYFFYLALRDEEALSINDQIWLMGARKDKADYEFDLESPEKVSHYLELYDYSCPSMFNISLLGWLIDESKSKNNPATESNEDENKKSSPLEIVINSIVKVAQVSNENTFAKIAVDKIPEFPSITVPIYSTFYKDVNEHNQVIDRTRFTLSIMHDYDNGQNQLQQYDNNNDEFMKEELTDKAGTYTTQILDFYDNGSMIIRSNIALALETLETQASKLEMDADSELLKQIAKSNHYLLTKNNLQVICDLFCDPKRSKKYELDRVQVSHHELAWDIILQYADDFVDEYFVDGEDIICCSEPTFITLINSEMTPESRYSLMEGYTGKIEKISDIKNIDNSWNEALGCKIVQQTKENIIKVLDDVGASEQWASYVNSFEKLDLKVQDFPDESREDLLQKALACNELDDDKYVLFIRCADPYTFQVLPNDLDDEKAALWFESGIISLNDKTITKARECLNSDELADYELTNLDDFLTYAKSVDHDEIVEILKRIKKEVNDRIDEIVDLLRSPVSDISEMSDIVVLGLCKKLRLTTSTYKDLFLRYGHIDDLDDEILGIAYRSLNSDISQYAPSTQLLLDINESYTLSIQQKLKIIQAVMHNGSTDLDKVLRALDNSDIEDILDGKHPKYEKLDPESKQIVNALISEGYLVDHGDRGIYKKEKKWKSDSL